MKKLIDYQEKPPRKINIPVPGKPFRGSNTGRPIMAALSLFSRRWVLRIIWELRNGSLGFRELQARCDRLSPDTLSTRLSELQEAGIAQHDKQGAWELTPLGMEIGPTVKALSKWATTWEKQFNDQREL